MNLQSRCQVIGASELPLYAEYLAEYSSYREAAYCLLAQQAVGKRLLEIDSGLIPLAPHIRDCYPDMRVTTVESNPIVLEQLHQSMAAESKWEWLIGDETSLPFGADQFDTVVSADGLHRWVRPVEALGEIKRVVRQGGKVLLVDLCRDAQRDVLDMVLMNLRSKAPPKRDWMLRYFVQSWVNAYTDAEIREIVKAACINDFELYRNSAMTRTLSFTRD
jgi:ubiquinone/menaquinone biosynthesis C-methylase UbiE